MSTEKTIAIGTRLDYEVIRKDEREDEREDERGEQAEDEDDKE